MTGRGIAVTPRDHDRDDVAEKQRHAICDTRIVAVELTRARGVPERLPLEAVNLIRVYCLQQATADSFQPE